MKRRIVLLCNTCPFGGEVFLQNELKLLPPETRVTLVPANQEKRSGFQFPLPEGVELCRAAETPTAADRILSLSSSMGMLFRTGEIRAVFQKRNPLRNLLKALKFGYLGESWARSVERWLRRNHPGEEFLFYSYWLYEVAFEAIYLKKQFPASPTVSRCHGYDLYEQRHANGYLPYRRYLLNGMDRIFPIAESGAEYLKTHCEGCRRDKIQVHRLGTRNPGLPNDRSREIFTVVSCSAMLEVKRVDRVIKALEMLPFEVRWIHLGGGALRDRLKTQAQKLPQNIHWKLPGWVSNEQVLKFYREHSVDVFVNTSVSEGVPVSIMEALSFGIPAIATDVGGEREILADGFNGYVISAEEDRVSTELAERLEQIYRQHDAERRKMRENARALWESRFCAEQNYEIFYRTLNDLNGSEFGKK